MINTEKNIVNEAIHPHSQETINAALATLRWYDALDLIDMLGLKQETDDTE